MTINVMVVFGVRKMTMNVMIRMMIDEVIKVHPWAEPFLTPTEWAAPSMANALNPRKS